MSRRRKIDPLSSMEELEALAALSDAFVEIERARQATSQASTSQATATTKKPEVSWSRRDADGIRVNTSKRRRKASSYGNKTKEGAMAGVNTVANRTTDQANIVGEGGVAPDMTQGEGVENVASQEEPVYEPVYEGEYGGMEQGGEGGEGY